jgi:hypothetical protein
MAIHVGLARIRARLVLHTCSRLERGPCLMQRIAHSANAVVITFLVRLSSLVILGRSPSKAISTTRRDCDEPEVEARRLYLCSC